MKYTLKVDKSGMRFIAGLIATALGFMGLIVLINPIPFVLGYGLIFIPILTIMRLCQILSLYVVKKEEK